MPPGSTAGPAARLADRRRLLRGGPRRRPGGAGPPAVPGRARRRRRPGGRRPGLPQRPARPTPSGSPGRPGRASRRSSTGSSASRPAADGVAQLGVLAVDPSSPFSGGAILGDRVRMQDHALDAGVFIRSMATRGHLGGLAVAVPEAIRVLSAVGIPAGAGRDGRGRPGRRSRWPRPPTPPSWWSTPGGATPSRPTRPGSSRSADLFVINKADRPGAPRDPARPRADARPDRRSATGARRSSRRWPPPATGSTQLWERHRRAPGPPDRRPESLEAAPAPAARHASSDQILLARLEEQIDDLVGGRP